MNFLAFTLPYILIVGWFVFSIRALIRYKKSNPYIYQIIPSVFTTLGVFGTFTGIAYGLFYFDVKNINESIPELLAGMKTAFMTSILGIFLSVIFSNILAWIKNRIDNEVPPKPTSELQAMQTLIDIVQDGQKSNLEAIRDMKKEFVDTLTIGNSSSEILIKTLEDEFLKNNKLLKSQFEASKKLQDSNRSEVVKNIQVLQKSTEETKKELTKLSSEQKEIGLMLVKSVKDNNLLLQQTKNELTKIGSEQKEMGVTIVQSMNNNNLLLQERFTEFSELLAKNNTEALVKAMETVITDFNEKMNELIQKLVKENFQELNNSVKRLNDWQIENKNQVEKLITQFKDVSNNLQISAVQIKGIADNTSRLTNDNSHLKKLIIELQKVMIEDTKFTQITDKVEITIDTLKSTTNEFEATTNKLNQWVREERNIKVQIDKLLSKMQELDKIKSYDEQFWQETKKKMEAGVSIIENANRKLANDVSSINSEFYNRLNTTLQSLDRVIQQIIQNNLTRR